MEFPGVVSVKLFFSMTLGLLLVNKVQTLGFNAKFERKV